MPPRFDLTAAQRAAIDAEIMGLVANGQETHEEPDLDCNLPLTDMTYCPDIPSDVRKTRRLRKAVLAALAAYPWHRDREEM